MRFRSIIVLIVLVLCQSCCTQALWNRIEPTRDTVWFSAASVSEQELVARGVEYRKCEDPLLGSGYVVKKTGLERFRDWTIVTLVTPVTVVIDGTAIVVYAVLTNPEILQILRVLK